MPKITTTDVDTILEKYPSEPHYLISLMQDVQSVYNYVSPEHFDLICTHVGVPRTRAWSVATFYKSLVSNPGGNTKSRSVSARPVTSEAARALSKAWKGSCM